MKQFVPARLTQARKAMMLNMTELAKRTGLTRQAISQFERGEVSPSARSVRRFASELQVSDRFFGKPLSDFERASQSPPSFRSMASATAKARAQAESYLQYSAMLCANLFTYIDVTPPRLPNFQIPEFHDISDQQIDYFAEKTRREFGIGDGPISNLTRLLENHGIIVVQAPIDSRLEGLSQWYDNRPFILLDTTKSCSRQRYSLAHELGHLILHRGLLSDLDLQDRSTLKMIERQADQFAACFLLPESSFSMDIYGTDWDSLIRLKKRWLVSIAAIVMRLADIGLISQHQKTRLFQKINIKKARRVEPLDREIPVEQPRLFQQIAEVLSENQIIEPIDWQEQAGINTSLLATLTGIPTEDFAGASANRIDRNVIYLKSNAPVPE